MIRNKDQVIMRGIAICLKDYLKPEEAMIYCNLARTQLAKKCEEYGIQKNKNGYYKRSELDLILSGGPTLREKKISKM
jgi:hypothetical protein